MPRNNEWQTRIKSVEREYLIVSKACEDHLQSVHSDPSLLTKEYSRHDIDSAFQKLTGTYLIRLYAEFEAGLREFYASFKPNRHPQMSVLINTIASIREIPNEVSLNVHAVRELRNQVVHNSSEKIECEGLREHRHHLCTYFSQISFDW